jgi:hypothetical protein
MAKYEPHPLVTTVARTLAEKDVGTLKAEAEKKIAEQRQADESAEDEAYAEAYANQANLPGLSLIAGYLGGSVSREGVPWRLVYLDARLDTWLLVNEDDIVVHQPPTDEKAPFGERDMLWVDASANLLRGSGPRTNDGRFLVGELTRAGDFAASSTGGTFSAATGLLCEATTPGCCIRPRTR